MAKLAILGHKTRGKEVIEILEMLEGKNTAHFDGENTGLAYYIEVDKSICCIDIETKYHKEFYKITLEKFLEKFPYKVGDNVSSKYLKNYKIEKMEWEDTNNRVIYKLQGMGWYSVDELQPYEDDWQKAVFEANEHACNISLNIAKEGNTGNGIIYDEIDFDRCPCADKVQLILGDDFEIKVEDGKTFVVRKKIKYPKTYEECCKIMQSDPNFYIDTHLYSDKLDLLYKLLICRNAYWKIAGDEMGLGKAWEPDWTNTNSNKYCIYFVGDEIKKQPMLEVHHFLAFPTAEMRDAYKENFDNDIEILKRF